MAVRRILVVEDEVPIRQMIAFNLKRAGFLVDEVGDSQSARVQIANQRPDLLLVDWMLPGSSGLELIRLLRREEASRQIPIIMLTARADERDKITGLDGGADDYITKPFSPRELLSRINAILRRAAPPTDEPRVAGNLRLDPVSHQVFVGGQEIAVGPTEFRLLKFLMDHADRVYSRAQLLDAVWGQNTYVEERTVDVHIRRLRMPLEAFNADGHIQTVRGAGYRFASRLNPA